MEENQNPVSTTPVPPAPNATKKWIIIGIAAIVIIVIAQNMFSPMRMSERALERAIGEDYDIDVNRDGTVEIKGEDGESMNISAGTDVKLPNNWPSSIPLASEAKLSYAGSMNTGGSQQGLSVVYTTEMSVSEVTEFYKQELEQKDWKIEASVVTTDGSMITATKGEDESVGVYIGEADGVTTVNLTAQIPQ